MKSSIWAGIGDGGTAGTCCCCTCCEVTAGAGCDKKAAFCSLTKTGGDGSATKPPTAASGVDGMIGVAATVVSALDCGLDSNTNGVGGGGEEGPARGGVSMLLLLLLPLLLPSPSHWVGVI